MQIDVFTATGFVLEFLALDLGNGTSRGSVALAATFNHGHCSPR